MLRLMLSEACWNRMFAVVTVLGIYQTKNLRMTLEGILWRLRTGAPWRDLPVTFGPWKTVYNQFNRWSRMGLWEKIYLAIRGEVDDEWNFIDGTIVKAHQHASGAQGKTDQAIGKSRGGNTTKVHMLCDAHGNPITFRLTGGHVHDAREANALIDLSSAETLIGDKGYDSEAIRDAARSKHMQPIIPRRCNSLLPNPEFDKELYRHRHLVENLFARLKHFRAFATRYDKLARNYSGVIFLGCMLVWLKL